MSQEAGQMAADELTVEQVIEKPLLLVNSDQEEVRALLAREIAREAEARGEKLSAKKLAAAVRDGLLVRLAVREVFEALAAEPFDHAALEELKLAAEVAGDFYDRIGPVFRELPCSVQLKGEVANPDEMPAWWTAEEGPPEHVEVSWVWGFKRIEDLDKELPLVWDALGGPAGNAWDRLFRLSRPRVRRGDYFICPECGDVFRRGAAGPRPSFCSSACRSKAWRRGRRTGSP